MTSRRQRLDMLSGWEGRHTLFFPFQFQVLLSTCVMQYEENPLSYNVKLLDMYSTCGYNFGMCKLD